MRANFQSFYLQEVDSTNITLRKMLEDGTAMPPCLLHAGKQTGGYGRNGRKWVSPKGNLYVSFAIKKLPIEEASQMGFVMSLAAFDVLEKWLPVPNLRLKWPNDILYKDAKIGGLLLENHDKALIIGIGLNIAKAPKAEKNRATTCLADNMEGVPLPLQQLCDILAMAFSNRYKFWQKEGFQAILSEWRSRAHMDGERLSVHWLGAMQNGTYAGLSEDGSLLLQSQEELLQISAGDVFLGDL